MVQLFNKLDIQRIDVHNNNMVGLEKPIMVVDFISECKPLAITLFSMQFKTACPEKKLIEVATTVQTTLGNHNDFINVTTLKETLVTKLNTIIKHEEEYQNRNA